MMVVINFTQNEEPGRQANPFEARDTFVVPHRFCVSEWDRRAATLLATTFWRYLWWVADTTAL